MASSVVKNTELVLLHPDDNILICVKDIAAGSSLKVDDLRYLISAPIPVGHKVARADLSRGTQIIRYGVPIGTLVQDVSQGEHVHIHNLKSDYIPSTLRNSVAGGNAA